MRRRTYLATATALLAGCTEDGGESGEPTDETATPTASQLTPPETAQPTDTPTETQTATHEDPLVRFETALIEAVDRYVPAGVAFQDVNGSHTDVAKSDVVEPLERAERIKETVEESPPSGDRLDRFEKLKGVFWFLWWTTEAHGHAVTAWERHRAAWEEMLANEGGISSSLAAVDDAVDDVEVALNRLLRDSEPGDVSAFPRLVESDYSGKRKRINSDIGDFRTMTDELDEFNTALDDAERGMNSYDSGNFDSAAVYFDNAETGFGARADEFRSYRWTGTFSTTASEVQCIANAMEAGCDRMIDIAQAAADGNEDNPQAAKEAARRQFESCDLVFEKVAIVDDFYS